jgi:branched-chain amino acid transport system substrate-binding protein
LASYGEQYLEGFEVGLDYATDGTGEVNGREIEVTERDTAGDPADAVSAATDLIGEGYTILAGPASSGVSTQVAPLAEQNQILYISGSAATDELTGINDYTFRSGRQTYQDLSTASSLIGDMEGKKVTTFAQDSAFGQANVAGVEAVLGGQGAQTESILVPPDTNDFTPFARQAEQSGADLLFVAWAGASASNMWQALDQQGALDDTTVATGLDIRSSYDTFGPASEDIQFLSHYFYQAPDNEANQFLVDELEARDTVPDLFHPDGFVAAQMIVRALEEGSAEEVDSMVQALEGYSFEAPKGEQTVRASDHAMLQPMFTARLAESGDTFEPELVETLPAEEVAPPEPE